MLVLVVVVRVRSTKRSHLALFPLLSNILWEGITVENYFAKIFLIFNQNPTCIRLSLAVSIAFKVSRLIGILEPKIGVSKTQRSVWCHMIRIFLKNISRFMLWGFGVPSAGPPGASSSPGCLIVEKSSFNYDINILPDRAKNRFLKATSRVPIARFFCRFLSRFCRWLEIIKMFVTFHTRAKFTWIVCLCASLLLAALSLS